MTWPVADPTKSSTWTRVIVAESSRYVPISKKEEEELLHFEDGTGCELLVIDISNSGKNYFVSVATFFSFFMS